MLRMEGAEALRKARREGRGHVDRLRAVIAANPADYTAWEWLRECDVVDWEFADTACWENPKNYQTWQHRRCLLMKLLVGADADALQAVAEREYGFLDAFLDDVDNAKNYHAYSHRQWLIQQRRLTGDARLIRELDDFTARHVERDPLNNSAWQHRWAVHQELQRRGRLHEHYRDALAQRLHDDGATFEPVTTYLHSIRRLLQPNT
ncbi:hypothetical protein CDCA_CDCA03G0949 [Cyanidium caldarium]|uniref:Protein farnesyltransferase/geranylgeranyltransferase type-1 subunit alpha n=1 Tax=Cyanidium caldarium TaxID=2771 RepID=A0AAV9IRP0_CYACA|nr:hypothetical protein CDCA_CDCA03G0949 [Cyanidium caldarium]|eukprot:ctg_1946.g536